MSLRRRLLLYLAATAPLVWAAALAFSWHAASGEVNELFDTELIRLARQVQGALRDGPGQPAYQPGPRTEASAGAAELDDLAVAVWDGQGRLLVNDREGAQLRFRPDASGFVDETIQGDPWRVYYLQSPDRQRLVAAGQSLHEREELVGNLLWGQLLPWLLVLPGLLAAMGWAIRQALAPLDAISRQLAVRPAHDLSPLPDAGTPSELAPLVQATNGLFARIAGLLARERRFTADAAHELRTPLAFLRTQWDVVRRSSAAERERAEAQFSAGLERMDRLVTQLLALSRAEAADARLLSTEIAWPAIVERVLSDCLPLATRREVELACEWPAGGRPALPLLGDTELLTVLLRNLVDNAIRYTPRGTTVTLLMQADAIEVVNEAPPLPAGQLARLGERFSRPDGQDAPGRGLGLSIVQRIGALHGLSVEHAAGPQGRGVRAIVRFSAP